MTEFPMDEVFAKLNKLRTQLTMCEKFMESHPHFFPLPSDLGPEKQTVKDIEHILRSQKGRVVTVSQEQFDRLMKSIAES